MSRVEVEQSHIELEPSNTIQQAAEQERITKRHGIMAVVAGHVTNFVVFGIGFTFGVFQDFYISEEGPLAGEAQSKVAIVGTLATSLTYMLGIFNGPLSARVNVQTQMLFGGITMALGLIITSWCKETWQFAMTQGIMYGVGSSMTYLPPVVCAPPYFSERRGIAMGILFAGTGVGGFSMAPFSRFLISQVGWQWAVRILGFITLALTAVASRLVFPHPSYRPSRNMGLVNVRIAKTAKFMLHTSGGLLQSAGYLVPLFFMSSYGQTLGIPASRGAWYIGINNLVNAFSKVFFGFLADYVGRLNMLVFCCLVSMASVFGLWMIPNEAVFTVFVVVNGVFSGPIIALLPACLVELFGAQNYNSISGFMYFCRGVGNMLGSPIAGLFVKSLPLGAVGKPEDYRNAIIYTGAVLAANCVLFLTLRGVLAVEDKRVRV